MYPHLQDENFLSSQKKNFLFSQINIPNSTVLNIYAYIIIIHTDAHVCRINICIAYYYSRLKFNDYEDKKRKMYDFQWRKQFVLKDKKITSHFFFFFFFSETKKKYVSYDNNITLLKYLIKTEKITIVVDNLYLK